MITRLVAYVLWLNSPGALKLMKAERLRKGFLFFKVNHNDVMKLWQELNDL